jgi:hypothetical protein
MTMQEAYEGNQAPIISTQPFSQAVAPGTTVTFRAVAISSQVMTYQWFFNDVAILAANSTSLIVPKATLASVGEYNVVVTNASGSTASNNALLSII